MGDKGSKKDRTGTEELAKWEEAGKPQGNGKIFAGVGILVVIGVFLIFGARRIGAGIGETAGSFAGTVKGSFDGITQGLAGGYEAGREQGLAAEDTEVEVSEITAVGKLDVLAAEDQIVDRFQEGEDYQGLFVYKAEAVFSVDLTQAEVTDDGGVVTIRIPGPEVDCIIDENESEKMAEWQKHFWSGNAESGYIGYMNSMVRIKEGAAEEMKKNEYLMKQAKESAIRQVETLARSVSVEGRQIIVEFKEEEK